MHAEVPCSPSGNIDTALNTCSYMHDAMYKICHMPICIRYLLRHFKENAFVDMHIATLHLWVFEDHLSLAKNALLYIAIIELIWMTEKFLDESFVDCVVFPCFNYLKNLYVRILVNILIALFIAYCMFRDFCDAEAVLLGYSPFNWKEWSFTIEQVQLIFMKQIVS